MSSSGTSVLLGIAALVNHGTSLIIAVALIVVAVLVRRTRPDAFGLLLGAALVYLGNRVVGAVLGALLPVLSIRAGAPSMESYAQSMVAVDVLSSLLALVAFGLLMAGILRLARPPGDRSERAAFAEGRYQGM